MLVVEVSISSANNAAISACEKTQHEAMNAMCKQDRGARTANAF